MKVVIIGGTGLIGSRLVARLREQGHEAVPASPASGVDTLTGQGLADAFAGADVVVDVSNSPSFEAAAVLNFFETSTRNMLAAELATGVRHHVVLSVVGTERLAESGYMRAKVAQERIVGESPVPFSIVRVTQFFEFIARIIDGATAGNTVRVAPVLFQPMAADDVAMALAGVAVGSPLNATIEVGGPQQFRFDELLRETLAAGNDPREVVADPQARYFGALLSERSLVPNEGARRAETTLAAWRSRNPVPPPQPAGAVR